MLCLPSWLELDAEIISRSLREYVKAAWAQVEPARVLMWNWHIDAICDHLEAVTRYEIKRLVINVPPGSMKSLLCGVFWPSWTWTHTPSAKFITSSYSDKIARRDAIRARQLMESPWYQSHWGSVWRKNPDVWSSLDYRNSEAGFRISTTVAGGITGEHADHQLVDDPVKPLDASGSKVDSTKLMECRVWWDETMTSRVVDPEKSTRTIIMQRLHDSDLSGHVLPRGDYTHLCLPMRYEKACVISKPHPCSLGMDGKGNATSPTPLGYKDTREEDQLLWPERFPESIQQIRKEEMGPRGIAAQDQQRPVPAGGGIFKREWIQYWKEYKKYGARFIQSWDCTFKGLADSDYVVGQVWAMVFGEYFLVDQVRGQMGLSETIAAIKSLSAKWPRSTAKLIEDKANGPAVIDLMKKKIPGMIPINPQGGKVARAHAVEALWAADNVYLPDPELAPWVHDFIEELITFNGDPGRHDDQVDAMTQALVYLHNRTVANYRKAMMECIT